MRRKVCAACADPYAEPCAEPYADGILLESGLMRSLARRKARKDIDNLARRKVLHKATLEQNPLCTLRASTYVREVSCAGLVRDFFGLDFFSIQYSIYIYIYIERERERERVFAIGV